MPCTRQRQCRLYHWVCHLRYRLQLLTWTWSLCHLSRNTSKCCSASKLELSHTTGNTRGFCGRHELVNYLWLEPVMLLLEHHLV